MSLPFNKVCEIEDFGDPELSSVIREVCTHKASHFPAAYPAGAEHRKDWEMAMAVRALDHFGALRPDATLLGVAVGREDTLFHLTRRVKQVFATDRYYEPGVWGAVAPGLMLVEPQDAAPFDFDVERLVVQHMDGRWLRYPSGTFDGIFSSGSIEHFGELEDAAYAAYEMGRVLRPGGVLALSTEFRLSGPAEGIGWPGRTLLFSKENLQRYIVEASGLTPVDEIVTTVSRATLSKPRDLDAVIADRMRPRPGEASPEFVHWDFPHLVLVKDDYVFGSVHLTLRKGDPYPAAPNEWARPPRSVRSAISGYNRSVAAGTGSAPSAEPDGSTTPAPAAAPPAAAATGSPPVPPAPAATPAAAVTGAPPVPPASAATPAAAGPESPPPDTAPAPAPPPAPVQPAQPDQRVLAAQRLEEMADRLQTVQVRAGAVQSALGRVDRLLGAIDRDRDEVDARLRDLEPLCDRLEVRLGQPDLAWAPEAAAPASAAHQVVLSQGMTFTAVTEAVPRDENTRALAAGQIVDSHVLNLMLDVLQPGDRVLDLGAHVGAFALAAAAMGCPVIAVEGSPANAALLRASVWHNGFHHVHVVNAAVADAPGMVQFHAAGPHGHVAWDATEDAVPVPALTVDELAAELGWETASFVKLDIEGYETRALAGMQRLLGGPDAPHVLYESNGHTLARAGSSPHDLIAGFEALGYTVYMVDPGKLTRITSADMQPQTVVDCLAVKRRPPGLDDWIVVPSLTVEDCVRRVVAESRHDNPHCRAWLAGALALFPPELLRHPEVAGAVERLGRDAVPEIRAAVAWAPAGDVGANAASSSSPSDPPEGADVP